MRYFLPSIMAFVLLMCSCKTKKNVYVTNDASKKKEFAKIEELQFLVDTSIFYKTFQDKSSFTITERIKVTEYDAESGKPIKEAEAKRKITQDTDKVFTEEENQTVTGRNQLNVDHFRDVTKMMASEVKEETDGSEYAFGKWIAIGIICLIGGIVVYLKSR